MCRDYYYFAAAILVIVTLPACSDTDSARSPVRSAPSANAPTPQVSGSPAIETTSHPPWHLIGSKLDDANVREYLSKASGKPEREEAPGYGVFVSLYRDGVELSADTTGTITTVIIYASSSDQYNKYSGPMPSSLAWGMTRADVEKTLGQPADHSFSRNSTTGRHELYAEYPELDIYLNYDAKSASDMQAKLIDIRIKNADL